MREISRAVGELTEAASVRVDGPELISAATIRVEADPGSVGRPARIAIEVAIVGQPSDAGSIGIADEDVFLHPDPVENQRGPVRRRLDRTDRERPRGNGDGVSDNGGGGRIEIHPHDVGPAVLEPVRNSVAV